MSAPEKQPRHHAKYNTHDQLRSNREKEHTVFALGMPVMAAGLYLGHKIHLGIGNRQMLMLTGALLLLSGMSLLWKAWA